MRRVALFVEDFAHRQVIGALVQRIAVDAGIDIQLDWRNARGGHGRVVNELKEYFRDMKRQGDTPDLIVVATDANCKGLNERIQELPLDHSPVPANTVAAIPDPHIERWLLLDGAAFKHVFGQGCDAPDQKCERNLYKQTLLQAIRATGTTPNLGGTEFAEEIIQAMDIERAIGADKSLGRFIKELRIAFSGADHSTP